MPVHALLFAVLLAAPPDLEPVAGSLRADAEVVRELRSAQRELAALRGATEAAMREPGRADLLRRIGVVELRLERLAARLRAGVDGLPPDAPLPMEAGAFERLRATLGRAAFADERLGLVREVAASNHFTARQVRLLLGAFGFRAHQLAAAEVLVPRMSDPQHAFELYDAARSREDREALRALVRRALDPATAPPPGLDTGAPRAE